MLLSHSAGTTVHGFPGYAVDEKRPTVVEVLNGTPPANTQPIVVDSPPNTKYNYSGGGVTIAQLAIMDQTRLSFPIFMHRNVLEPLGMTSSTYEQPLPPSRRIEAATAHKTSGDAVPGKWHIYPEMAAAGLWTTPSDLARVIIEMQNALAGHGRVLQADTARLMLTQRFPSGQNQWIGLGFFIEKHGDAMYFSHSGSNEGFRSLFIGSEDGHHGLAIMANSDNGGALLNELARTIAREYKWPGFEATTLHIERLSDAAAGHLAGRYRLPSGEVIALRRASDGFEVLDLTNGWTPLYSVGAETLARTDRNIRYAIRSDGLGVVNGDKTTVAERRPDDESPTARELLASGSIDQAIAAYRRQFAADPKSLPEPELNDQGYNLMFSNRLPEAATIMRLNTEFYPQSANAWDSLADVLLAAGDIAGAKAATDEELRRIDADPHASADLKKGLRANAEARRKQLQR